MAKYICLLLILVGTFIYEGANYTWDTTQVVVKSGDTLDKLLLEQGGANVVLDESRYETIEHNCLKGARETLHPGQKLTLVIKSER